MARSRDPDDGEILSPREAAHERTRERKRETRMVVDNAAVKRIAPAVAAKRARRQSPATAPDGDHSS